MSYDQFQPNPTPEEAGFIPPVNPVQSGEQPAGAVPPAAGSVPPAPGQYQAPGAPYQAPAAGQYQAPPMGAAYAAPGMGAPYGMPGAVPVEQKSAIVVALLAFFLGAFGIHNFYLGRNNLGIIQLLMTVFGWILLFIPNLVVVVWVLVEMVLYLVSNEPRWRYDARGVLISR